MKSKIETLRDAYGAVIDTDVNFFFYIEGACDAEDESTLSNFWQQATSMMPELLAFVDAVRDTMGEEGMSEEVRQMLKELEKISMKTKQEILAEIPNFYGTGAYHLWSGLFQNFIMTDGAKYIADECGAYWLMDLIASHVGSYKDEGFVVAKLRKTDADWAVIIEDGNDGQLGAQTIEYSDFPLDEITLYVVKQEELWVILLPGEY